MRRKCTCWCCPSLWWVGGPTPLLVLSEAQVDTLKRGDHTSPTPGMSQYADFSSSGVVEAWRIIRVCLPPRTSRALVLTVIRDQQQLIHERKRDTEVQFLWKWSHDWRCNLASHLLESSDQSFPISINHDCNESISGDTVFAHSSTSAVTLGAQRWKRL